MDELISVPAAQPPNVPARLEPAETEYGFQFLGDAREYFRIWVVNLALSLVTLGIYSAWAKVRSERYFYGNTRVAGVPFEYLAKPLPILKGRVIAFTLFAAYVLAGQFSVKLQLGLAGVVALLAPWLLVRGLMFRAHYSSWRALRFRFLADYKGAYVCYLLWLVPVAFTLGLLFPMAKFKQKQFLVEKHRFGGQGFRFFATIGKYYPPYLIAGASMIGWVVAVSLVLGGLVFAIVRVSQTLPPAWFSFVVTMMVYAGYFVIWASLAAALANILYNNAEIGAHRFRSTLKGRRLFLIYLGNTAAILASAGLMIPWAKVRLARYRARSLTLIARGDLAALRAEAGRDIDAVGAEMDGLFDIDIGL